MAIRPIEAISTSFFETQWSRCRTRFRSLPPSRARRHRLTLRSWAFPRAIRRRRRKWISCTRRTPPSDTDTRCAEPPRAKAPSRESSFVSRAKAVPGS